MALSKGTTMPNEESQFAKDIEDLFMSYTPEDEKDTEVDLEVPTDGT
jgi:hypothetical protein